MFAPRRTDNSCRRAGVRAAKSEPDSALGVGKTASTDDEPPNAKHNAPSRKRPRTPPRTYVLAQRHGARTLGVVRVIAVRRWNDVALPRPALGQNHNTRHTAGVASANTLQHTAPTYTQLRTCASARTCTHGDRGRRARAIVGQRRSLHQSAE